MSLLYYGEIWITENYAQVCQNILQDLKIDLRIEKVEFEQEKRVVRIKREPDCKVEVKLEPPDDDEVITSVTPVTPGTPAASVTGTPAAENNDDPSKPLVDCNDPGCSYKASSLSSLQRHVIHYTQVALNCKKLSFISKK